VSEGAGFGRPSLERLPPGDPIPLLPDDAASLGLNEGLHGPFPSALEAMAEALPALNRYPGRGSFELVEALAAKHEVGPENVIVTAGADAAIGYACQAMLEVGDEVVVPWPSFPSFVRDAQRRDATVIAVPLAADGAVDLEALRAAVTPGTRLLFIATPNNPTGLAVPRSELISFVCDLPERVLPVIDEAYFEYLDPDDRFDAIDDLVRAGNDVLALRTFSKLYGLAGLRVGYGVGPAGVITAMRKVQRGYDVGALSQTAALASLDQPDEVERRRLENREALAALTLLLQAHGLEPLVGSATNFVLVEAGPMAEALAASLREQSVSVQSGTPFGAPGTLRISAGSASDLKLLDAALRASSLSAR
jgi:histidinol-phosphate aminotransferase